MITHIPLRHIRPFLPWPSPSYPFLHYFAPLQANAYASFKRVDVAPNPEVGHGSWIDWLKERKGRIVERLKDAGRSGRPRSKSAVVDEELGWLLETAPSEFGYQAIGWTNPLLRQHFRSSYDLKVSHQTIREAIGRVGYRWKRPRYVLSRRPKHWRQAKGGSKKG